MRWRIWVYLFTLVVIVSVVVDVWSEQAGGAFSDPDRLLFSSLGLYVISPFLAFDFARWLIRDVRGPWWQVGLAFLVSAVGVGTALLANSLMTGCITEAGGLVTCWSGYQLHLGLLAGDMSMLIALLIGHRDLLPALNPQSDQG